MFDADEAAPEAPAMPTPARTTPAPRPRVVSDDFSIVEPDQAAPVAGPSRSLPKPAQHQPEVIHPWTKEVKQKLKGIFKMAGFRRNQKEIIDATLSGKDGETMRFVRGVNWADALDS